MVDTLESREPSKQLVCGYIRHDIELRHLSFLLSRRIAGAASSYWIKEALPTANVTVFEVSKQ